MSDYLDHYRESLPIDAIRAVRSEREPRKTAANMAPLPFTDLIVQRTAFFDPSQDSIVIGHPDELSAANAATLRKQLELLCPWKKGPFTIFGNAIDAEWRSDWKWQRILPHCAPLKGRRIADIGCNNGYFMFRMLAEHPELVIGFEPFARNWHTFNLLQSFVQAPQLAFELLGVEHADLFPQFFDTVFCLGVLYHHTDPMTILRKLHRSLRSGGELILECQGIPGDEPLTLVPRNRYAGAAGIWFLPTVSALTHWLQRASFAKVSCFFAEPLSTAEQRATPWAKLASLQDFLDPQDKSRTIEGYPAPVRIYMRATKP